MSKERAAAASKAFDSERNRAQYQAALSLWRQGDFAQCRELLDKVLYRDPNHLESLLLTADMELENDQPAEAVAVMRRAAEAHAQDAEVMYKLGLALEANHESSEALHFFHQATLLEPTRQKFVDAFAQAEQSLSGNDEPQETNPDVVLASAEMPIDDDAEEYDELDAALEAWQAGRKAECRRALHELLEQLPLHIEANILQAEVDLDAGRDDEARDRMERLVIRLPADPQVRRACGLMYQTLGEIDLADSCFARAEQLEAGEFDTDVEFSATSIAETADSNIESIEATSFVDALPVNESEAVEAPRPPELEGTDLERGLAALRSGRIDDAETLLAAAVASARNSEAAISVSVAALQCEQAELAAKLADAGLSKHPRSAALHRIKGTALLRAGREREAVTPLRQSLSLDNTQALTYFLLGSVLKRLDQAESADWHFSQAARLDGRYALRK